LLLHYRLVQHAETFVNVAIGKYTFRGRGRAAVQHYDSPQDLHVDTVKILLQTFAILIHPAKILLQTDYRVWQADA
jgi:hypothetical protein